jgi:hypothetical protein
VRAALEAASYHSASCAPPYVFEVLEPVTPRDDALGIISLRREVNPAAFDDFGAHRPLDPGHVVRPTELEHRRKTSRPGHRGAYSHVLEGGSGGQ